MAELVGLVLAAGASTRLGRPKQMVRYGDTTLLEHVVSNAEQSTLDRVVVVINAASTVPAARAGGAEFVVNHEAATGAASSLQTGLRAASGCDAAVILLGDMPEVDAAIIDEVAGAWRRRPTWAAVSRYADGGIAHPFLFSAESFEVLRTLRGDKAIWRLLDQAPPGQVARIDHPRPTPLDVDTWDDYLTVCARAGVTPEARSVTEPTTGFPRAEGVTDEP